MIKIFTFFSFPDSFFNSLVFLQLFLGLGLFVQTFCHCLWALENIRNHGLLYPKNDRCLENCGEATACLNAVQTWPMVFKVNVLGKRKASLQISQKRRTASPGHIRSFLLLRFFSTNYLDLDATQIPRDSSEGHHSLSSLPMAQILCDGFYFWAASLPLSPRISNGVTPKELQRQLSPLGKPLLRS